METNFSSEIDTSIERNLRTHKVCYGHLTSKNSICNSQLSSELNFNFHSNEFNLLPWKLILLNSFFLSCAYLAFQMDASWECRWESFHHFIIERFIFLLLTLRHSAHLPDVSPLSDACRCILLQGLPSSLDEQTSSALKKPRSSVLFRGFTSFCGFILRNAFRSVLWFSRCRTLVKFRAHHLFCLILSPLCSQTSSYACPVPRGAAWGHGSALFLNSLFLSVPQDKQYHRSVFPAVDHFSSSLQTAVEHIQWFFPNDFPSSGECRWEEVVWTWFYLSDVFSFPGFSLSLHLGTL